MRKMALAILMVLGMMAVAQAGSFDSCVEAYDKERGKQCNSRSSSSMRIRNGCSQNIDMQYCMKRSNGTWDCGVKFDVAPGDSTSYYICDADIQGIYMLYGREAGSKEKFPKP